jgi:cephalosporin hydroxylase
MTDEDQERVIADFARLYWDGERSVSSFFNNTFMGVPTLQHPFDAWITQEIIFETAPDLVVECGSFFGGSAIMWALLLEQVSSDARVVAVDLSDNMDQARQNPVFQRRVTFVQGSSIAPDVIDQVHELAAGRKAMVILDSLHTQEHVAAELAAYSDLVAPGCYLIVQDGFVNGHPLEPDWGPGPYEAVEDFLARDDRFEQDRARERMLFTFNPGGFLRRR